MSESEGTSSSQTDQATSSEPNSVTQSFSVPRSGLPPFPPFDPIADSATISQRWKKWIRRFENLLISLREFDSTIRRGLLLTYVGEATNDIFDILPDTGTTYETAVESLTQYFTPRANKDVAIFEFREIAQASDETLTEFHRRLKTKATDCEFANEDEEIKIQIIHKTRDARLRKKALRESMSLKDLLNYGKSLEITDQQAKKLENANLELNALNRRKDTRSAHHRRRNSTPSQPNTTTKNTCRNCGGSFPHKGGMQTCPARKKSCHKCGKDGHFAKLCRSSNKLVQNVTPVQTADERYLQESDDDNCFNLKSTPNNAPETWITMGNTPVKVLIDSGASVNIVHQEIFERIKNADTRIKLTNTNAKVRAYGAEKPLELSGEFRAKIKSANGQVTHATVYVTSGRSQCILGCETCTALGLFTLNINNIEQHRDPVVAKLLNKHQKLFKGTGNLKGVEVKLEID